MAIKSNINSFVNFNEELLTCNGQTRQAALPVYDNFGMKFQFFVDDLLPTDTIFKAAVCTAECDAILYNPDYEVVPICQRWVLVDTGDQTPVPSTAFPILVGNYAPQPGQPKIPEGTYTQSQFLAAINDSYDISLPALDFVSCCSEDVPEISGIVVFYNGMGSAQEINFTSFYHDAWVNFPETEIEGILNTGDCFRYCILNEADEVQACSNLFKVIADDCKTTLFRYYSDGSSSGFKYVAVDEDGELVITENTIRLWVNFKNPEPVNLIENTFRLPSGRYQRNSTLYDWQYMAEVAPLSAEQYRQLVAMLKHDNVIATDIEAGINGPITSLGTPEIIYNDQVRAALNPATFAVIDHRSNDVNNNCGSDCGIELISDCEGGGGVTPACPDKYFIEFAVPGAEMGIDQTTYTNATLATLSDVTIFREGTLQYPFGTGYTATFAGGVVTFNPGVQQDERIAIWEV